MITLDRRQPPSPLAGAAPTPLQAQPFQPAPSPKPLFGDVRKVPTFSAAARTPIFAALPPAVRKLPLLSFGLSTGLQDDTDPVGYASNDHVRIEENKRTGVVTLIYSPKGLAAIRKGQNAARSAAERPRGTKDPLAVPVNRKGEAIVTLQCPPDPDWANEDHPPPGAAA